jgi:hypothetical protein
MVMKMRIALLTSLLLATLPIGSLAAQPERSATARDAAPAVVDERTARDTRQRLHEILDQYPPSLAQVLRLDPSLITKADYVEPYPTLAAFLAQHPEVAHNPVFFLGSAASMDTERSRQQVLNTIDGALAGVGLFLAFVTLAGVVMWLTRAGIEHRRWLRATKMQTDAHMKLVERLTSNEDLMAYMQSPAGQRFLSSSPMTVDVIPHTVSAPLNRILWSVQGGVVLATSGVGLWLAKANLVEEVAQPLHVMAILAIALGVGFVLSALVSYMLSRELGLVGTPTPHE